MPMHLRGVIPPSKARWLARWMVVPSASGSEKGMPSSTMSQPASTSAGTTSNVVSTSG